MPKFSQLMDVEIIKFIEVNFSAFSSQKDDDFPGNVLDGIARGQFAVVKFDEGFAVAYRGWSFGRGLASDPANLMFLYVAPEFEGQGIGSKLVEQVKREVVPEIPIIMQCEGANRKHFFEGRGFVVTARFEDPEEYKMHYNPVFVD